MKLGKLVTALTLATVVPLFSADKFLATEKAYKIIGLAPNNILVRFDTDSRKSNSPIEVKGVGRDDLRGDDLQCIDFRPADGKLYGLTDADKLYYLQSSCISQLGATVHSGFLGINFEPIGGFDIYSPKAGTNTAFAASSSSLYRINLKTGAA